jgi:S1-C subfamily serine protease
LGLAESLILLFCFMQGQSVVLTKGHTGTGFFITDDGYLISNYHVVKDATKVRLLTGAGLIDAKVVQVDAANDLALLKADGFAPLPIVPVARGFWAARWLRSVFPTSVFAGVRARKSDR